MLQHPSWRWGSLNAVLNARIQVFDRYGVAPGYGDTAASIQTNPPRSPSEVWIFQYRDV